MKKTIKNLINTTLAFLLLANVLLSNTPIHTIDNSNLISTYTFVDLEEMD